MDGFDLSWELFCYELIVIALTISGAPRGVTIYSLSIFPKGSSFFSGANACENEASLEAA